MTSELYKAIKPISKTEMSLRVSHHPLLMLAIMRGRVQRQMMRSASATLHRKMFVGTRHRRNVSTTAAIRRFPSAPTTATNEIIT